MDRNVYIWLLLVIDRRRDKRAINVTQSLTLTNTRNFIHVACFYWDYIRKSDDNYIRKAKSRDFHSYTPGI